MMRILSPDNPEDTIEQPVVLLNYHMSGMKNMPEPVRSWEVIYHLRLLSVQYLAMAEGGEGEEMTESEIEDMFLEATSEREVRHEDEAQRGAKRRAMNTILALRKLTSLFLRYAILTR